MSEQDLIERAVAVCERAIFTGALDGLAMAESELDTVEAALALARGRIRQVRSREHNDEDPAELALYERAAELFRSSGDVRGESEATLWIGAYHQLSRHDGDAAVPHLERAYELAARADDRLTMSSALRLLGIVAYASGRLDLARERLEKSSRLRRDLGFVPGLAANLVGLAWVAAGQGRRPDAFELLKEAESLAAADGATAILGQVERARTEILAEA